MLEEDRTPHALPGELDALAQVLLRFEQERSHFRVRQLFFHAQQERIAQRRSQGANGPLQPGERLPFKEGPLGIAGSGVGGRRELAEILVHEQQESSAPRPLAVEIDAGMAHDLLKPRRRSTDALCGGGGPKHRHSRSAERVLTVLSAERAPAGAEELLPLLDPAAQERADEGIAEGLRRECPVERGPSLGRAVREAGGRRRCRRATAGTTQERRSDVTRVLAVAVRPVSGKGGVCHEASSTAKASS
ncbi:hypothetical protein WMF42_19980 [Sorangium sp. So ce176]